MKMFVGAFSNNIRIYHKFLVRGMSSTSSWDITAAVCVERLPVVTPPLNAMQKKYKHMLNSLEVEKSLKSDHELRHEADKLQAKLLKKESAEVDIDVVSKVTAQDFEDASNEEYAQFKFANIETEADKINDKTSLDRYLQRYLVLVTEQKLGSDSKSLLPQGKWREGETLRQTAERVLMETCGSELSVQFLSNAPCGFYKYKYPTLLDGKVGAKVFFYYANYKSGSVANKLKSSWLTRDEMNKIFPEKYGNSVTEFLIDEDV